MNLFYDTFMALKSPFYSLNSLVAIHCNCMERNYQYILQYKFSTEEGKLLNLELPEREMMTTISFLG